MKNILLIKGGGGSEHDISLISADYIKSKIDSSKFNILSIEITKENKWLLEGVECSLGFDKKLSTAKDSYHIDAVIPCLHGYPGETGDIQSLLDLIKVPYFGCSPETSKICFNKLLTKLMLENAGLKTAPFLNLNNQNDLDAAIKFQEQHGIVYIKATNQGSSVGCYKADSSEDVRKYIPEAFKFSPFVIIEKGIVARELEVAVFEYKGEVHITKPGEISCPGDFYTFEEKYSDNSETKTFVVAPDIGEETIRKIHTQSQIAFQSLKLRHLSRIDFFLTPNGEVIINEINTFPGHTSISMFPTMMENYGVKYSDFMQNNLELLTQKS